MTKILREGLDYQDFVGQIDNFVSVDEYVAKMGDDSDIVTLAFVVKGRTIGEDLSDWFERGYDWVLDAQVSDGELDTGKYLVFVEMNRRSTVPERIVSLLEDLKTLTEYKIEDWVLVIKDGEYPAEEEVLKSVIKCSPREYRRDKEKDLNEMRQIAGLETVDQKDHDEELKKFLSNAGM